MPKPSGKPIGRPSKYTDDLAEEICSRLSAGEPLAQICRDEHMPSVSTVWDWERKHDGLSEAIARGRRDGHDVIAARTRCTARGKTEAEGGDSSGDVQRDKLIIDTDLKLLAKWDPKRYGDRLELDHKGSIATLPDEQLDARLAKLLGKAGTDRAPGGEGAAQGEE